MIPNPAEVVRRQWTAAGLFRIVAVLLGVAAMLAIVAGVSYAFTYAVAEGWRQEGAMFALFFAFLSGGGIALVAWGVFVFSQTLARLVARYPQSVPCPRCFYGLEGLAEPRCPECGLDLTPEFLPPHTLRPAPETAPQSVVRHRLVFMPVIRVLSILFAVPLSGALLGLGAMLAESARTGYNVFEEPAYILAWLWWLTAAAFCASGVFLPRLWARFVVPAPSPQQMDLLGPATRESPPAPSPTTPTDARPGPADAPVRPGTPAPDRAQPEDRP